MFVVLAGSFRIHTCWLNVNERTLGPVFFAMSLHRASCFRFVRYVLHKWISRLQRRERRWQPWLLRKWLEKPTSPGIGWGVSLIGTAVDGQVFPGFTNVRHKLDSDEQDMVCRLFPQVQCRLQTRRSVLCRQAGTHITTFFGTQPLRQCIPKLSH